MKFNIGDKFYIFEEHTSLNFFGITKYEVSDILMKNHNVFKYRGSETRWFSEKECLTKEEVIEKINAKIKKL